MSKGVLSPCFCHANLIVNGKLAQCYKCRCTLVYPIGNILEISTLVCSRCGTNWLASDYGNNDGMS